MSDIKLSITKEELRPKQKEASDKKKIFTIDMKHKIRKHCMGISFIFFFMKITEIFQHHMESHVIAIRIIKNRNQPLNRFIEKKFFSQNTETLIRYLPHVLVFANIILSGLNFT